MSWLVGLIARDLPLPASEAGEMLILRDVGAYALSMWSRPCSRLITRVIGYDGADATRFEVLRERERLSDLVRFWSRGAPIASY